MSTLKQIIIKAVASSKRALRNHEIQTIVQRKRPGTTCASVDTALYLAAKANTLVKIPLAGEGKAKFAYAPGIGIKPARLGINKLVRMVLSADKADSYDIFCKITHLNSGVTKRQVDGALQDLALRGKIVRSKNPMTDENTTSSQSKFLYSTI